MKRNPLVRFLPFRLALLVAPLLAAWPQQSRAANQEYTGATGGAWLTLTNWTSGTGFPGDTAASPAGEGTTTDIMTAAAANAATNIGINLNTSAGLLSLGAIDFNKTNTATCTIGNSSTTNSGILQLNGATVNAVANTILRCTNEANLTLSNTNAGTAAVTMGVRLGTANGNIFVGQNGAATPALRTLTINSIISEVTPGSGFTKSGTGNLTLTAANLFDGGLITVNDGILRLQHAEAAGDASILLTNGDGVAVNNNDVLITGGLTYTNAITLENTANQNARTRLQSTNTVNGNPNTWAGDITFKGPSSNQTIIADTAPLIIDGDFLQHPTTPSASMFIRGGSAAVPGTMNGNIFLGNGTLFKTDGGTWTINSTGNNMGAVICADGLLILNNNDALEADSSIQMGQGSATTGRLQINAGFTQQATGIFTITGSTSPTGHTIFGPGSIDLGGITRNINILDNTATITDLTINAPLLGAGGFNKIGAGNLIVNSAVTGPVNVNVGGLAGSGTLSSGVTVNTGGSLNGGSPVAAGTINAAGVTVASGGSLTVNAGSAGSDLINNTGTLAAAAGSLITVVPNGSLSTGQKIPVVGYTGASPGAGAFTVMGYLGIIGSRATVVPYDEAGFIGVEVTAADKVVWTGLSGDVWDIGGASNWKLLSDSSATTFQTGDAAVFDDTGSNTTISLAPNGALPTVPVRLEFNNTIAKPYTIGGAGALGGTMVLDKTGDGQLTLLTNNSYVGGTNVSAGTLIANLNIAAGSAVITPIPAASPVRVTGTGVVRYVGNNSTATIAAVNMPQVISGDGTVEHNARIVAGVTNALASTLTGANSGFTGTLRLLTPAAGTQRLTQVNASAVGSASIEVQTGHQFYTAASQTFNNAITIAGTGYQDANGFIGALRLDPGAVWAGPVIVAAGGGRIGSHNTSITTAGIVSGDISGGPLEVNVSNYPNSYTIVFTGNNSYTTTTVGGVGGAAPQTGASVSMRLNIGDGGTTGTLGTGAVTIAGDAGATNGTNGVLGFDRSDGYTLAPANTITGTGSSLARVFLDLDCKGAGFVNNSVTIDLGTPGAAAGNLRAGVSRPDTVSTLSGSIETGAFIIGNFSSALTPATNAAVTLNTGATLAATSVQLGGGGSSLPNGNTSGASLTIQNGATLSATSQIFLGEGVGNSSTVTSGGNVTAVTQVRAGHWGTEVSTWNMNGGTLLVTGPSSVNTPSTSGAGSATATGDNNIDVTNPATLVGGGIYLGIDGTGVLNHTAGTVSTNWIVLDNRGNSTVGGDGIDRYNISGSSLLKLRSEWGIIARNTSTDVSLGGGTIQIDNTGTGGPAGNTGADLDVPLDAILNTTASTTTLDTNGATNSFILTKDVLGPGVLELTGGGRINLRTTGTQTVAATLSGNAPLMKSDAGTTIVTAANSGYTGLTTVSAGTLRLDGTLADVTVSSGATLGGDGTAGSVTVQSGGIVAPGASVGALDAASVNLQAGSRYDVEITGAATADKLNVTGALTANGTVKVTLLGYVPVPNDTFDIADAGGISGTPAFDFTAAVLTAGLTWDTSQFAVSGVIRVAAPSDPFDAWAAGFGLTGGKGGDDDGDGANNLMEFATNANPVAEGSGARAYGRVHSIGGEPVLTLTIAVRKSAVFAAAGSTQEATKDRVIYTVEASDDLLTWNTVVVTELNAADSAAVQAALSLPALDADWEWHSFRTDGSTVLDPRDMIRLSVAAQP